MKRRRVASLIRRAGQPWFVKSRTAAGPLTACNAYLKSDNTTLSCADVELATGDLLHPQASPLQLFIVQERRDNSGVYEDYRVGKITHHAQVLRFSADGAKDTFGRPTTTAPALVYSDVPLLLLTDTSTVNTAPDRAAADNKYHFLTSDAYVLHPKDRLTVGSSNLIVSSVLLSAAGLSEFVCTESV